MSGHSTLTRSDGKFVGEPWSVSTRTVRSVVTSRLAGWVRLELAIIQLQVATAQTASRTEQHADATKLTPTTKHTSSTSKTLPVTCHCRACRRLAAAACSGCDRRTRLAAEHERERAAHHQSEVAARNSRACRSNSLQREVPSAPCIRQHSQAKYLLCSSQSLTTLQPTKLLICRTRPSTASCRRFRAGRRPRRRLPSTRSRAR